VKRLLLRRAISLPLVLLGMTLVTFAITHIVPGDPARLEAGPHATEAQVKVLRHQYGYDQPLVKQYVTYMGDLVHGNLGDSITTRRPVSEDLRQFFPATIELTLAAMLIVMLVGVPLGLIGGLRQGRASDQFSRLLSITAVSMPVFWLGIILQIVFYQRANILPVGGRIDPSLLPPTHTTGIYMVDALLSADTVALRSSLSHLILPAVTLAAGSMAVITRMTRASVIEVNHSDHVRASVAKGISRSLVIRRHVLPNAIIPVTTVFGLQIGTLLAGSILVEVVFSWPGIGLYAVNAISNLDFAAIMGVTLLISVTYVIVNLIVDICYLLLDPRIADAQDAGA
jgi:peptide/nickel transport system permease protein